MTAFVHEDGTACVAGYDGSSLECAEGHGIVLRADSYSRLRRLDWERIAREAVLHLIRHREDFHNASARPCPTCDKSAAFLDGLPREVVRAYVDSSCTSEQRTRGGRQ